MHYMGTSGGRDGRGGREEADTHLDIKFICPPNRDGQPLYLSPVALMSIIAGRRGR